jgi:gamma-glutamyl hercynylcysteine S-oxide synthase
VTATRRLSSAMATEELAGWIEDARGRTLALASTLGPEALLGPRLAIVNPPLWELGHVGWFQERWILRHAGGHGPLRADGDALYDSAKIPHDARWTLPLPSLAETLAYLAEVQRAALEALRRGADPYFARLAVFHEDMHFEAMAFTRQTLGAAAPPVERAAPADPPGAGAGAHPGDAHVPGGTFLLGASRDEPFVFDNEKWGHPVELSPFSIARAPVTQSEFAAFVDDGGYRRRELWSAPGWQWREGVGADRPVYWERRGPAWARRDFDRIVPLEPHRPMVHACWFEAEAFCRWTDRRLPTEAEWEAAAAGVPGPDGRLAPAKRRFPWGDAPPSPDRACLGAGGAGGAGRAGGVGAGALHALDVGALPAGDSAFGCRQLMGNVWEWTASDFMPYPGFVADPYREYSEPWFGTHKVLRGGSFATAPRLLRNTWRNFYTPDRRDPWAGFRTCAR